MLTQKIYHKFTEKEKNHLLTIILARWVVLLVLLLAVVLVLVRL